MQLFITPFAKSNSEKRNIWDEIFLYEERVVDQVKRVLRGKNGMQFFMQHPCYAATLLTKGEVQYRYLVELLDIQKKSLVCKIVKITEHKKYKNNHKLCVALPNKFEKAELIVQKATELGLQHLYFFSSEHSQLHEISENKMQRLGKIAWEATEQSYGLVVPNIVFEKNVENILKDWTNILLHQDGEEKKSWNLQEKNGTNFFVWPEWWRSQWDEKIFEEYNTKKISLWKNILRTETAAIIVAWEAVKKCSDNC